MLLWNWNDNKYLAAFGFSVFLCVPFFYQVLMWWKSVLSWRRHHGWLGCVNLFQVTSFCGLTEGRIFCLFELCSFLNLLSNHYASGLVVHVFVCWSGWWPEADTRCLPLSLCILFLWDRVFLQTETVTAVGFYPVSSFMQQWCHSSLYFPLWFFDIR